MHTLNFEKDLSVCCYSWSILTWLSIYNYNIWYSSFQRPTEWQPDTPGWSWEQHILAVVCRSLSQHARFAPRSLVSFYPFDNEKSRYLKGKFALQRYIPLLSLPPSSWSQQVFHFSITTHATGKKTLSSSGEQILVLCCKWETVGEQCSSWRMYHWNIFPKPRKMSFQVFICKIITEEWAVSLTSESIHLTLPGVSEQRLWMVPRKMPHACSSWWSPARLSAVLMAEAVIRVPLGRGQGP